MVKIQNKYKKLEDKHKKLLEKRQYHKFKKGPCFYIFSTSDDQHKIGFEGEIFNVRLQAHRTTYPSLKLHYLVYTPDAYLLEQNILTRYKIKKLEPNHEIIIDVPVNKLISCSNTLIKYLNLDYTIEDDSEIEKYNDS